MKNMKKPIVTILSILTLCISLTAADGGKAKDWISLFGGKKIEGFDVKGGYATYRVEDGCIVGKTAEGSKNTFLSTKREYSNFELELEVKCDPKLNSGIQIRSHVYKKDTPQASRPSRIRKAGEVYGYQCEIAEQGKGTSGNFWDEGRKTMWHAELSDEAKTALQDGEWNTYRIRAKGNHIQSWVNGIKCADFKDDMDASGFIGLQVHSIRKGSGPYEVRWRNIRIRKIVRAENRRCPSGYLILAAVTIHALRRRASPRPNAVTIIDVRHLSVLTQRSLPGTQRGRRLCLYHG